MPSAAQLAALRKRKDQQKRQLVRPDDVEEVRDAIYHKLEAELRPDLARAIETQLYQDHGTDMVEYRASFRRLLVSLKSKHTQFKQQLMAGDLDPHVFAAKKSEELKSKAQKKADEELRQRKLKDSVGKELLPENIQQIHDGRDREKWGVSRSAAAIDD